MARPTISEVMMAVAETLAQRSTCSARVRVGCVITDKDGHIISTGYNGSPAGIAHCDDVGCIMDDSGHCIIAIHAEENAIIQCATMGRSPVGGIVYVTHSPCVKCAGKLIQAGVSEIHFLHPYGSQKDFTLAQVMYNAKGISLIYEDILEEDQNA